MLIISNNNIINKIISKFMEMYQLMEICIASFVMRNFLLIIYKLFDYIIKF